VKQPHYRFLEMYKRRKFKEQRALIRHKFTVDIHSKDLDRFRIDFKKILEED